MICGTAQGLLSKKKCARTAAKINYYRRQLREHVQGCAFCQKQMSKTVLSIKRKVTT